MESTNDGDAIIVEAILKNFPDLVDVPRFPTHRRLAKSEALAAAKCDYLVVTGTNILNQKILRDRQWPLGLRELKAYRGRLVLLGVGWRQYQERPGKRTQKTLNKLLAHQIPVAARDHYTDSKLSELSIDSVNTGCPTTWNLPMSLPPLGSVDECVFTLTDYNPAWDIDGQVIYDLAARYKTVHAWPQSDGDLSNLNKMSLPANFQISRRGIATLDSLLEGRDYIGTRLHAGIRAAQHGRAILIIAVDNRAIEIGKDIGLPVVPRQLGPHAIAAAIDERSRQEALIQIPRRQVERWKLELRSLLRETPDTQREMK
ncbi:polysaccharide pyruvyl transferase family protein [Rhodococcus cercidiphylli]|uniref:Polysaccharide pyruvyl transferase domain-containing protein n=1 Tax=Rhodococcus cercidiphylli TaxID=489916 RepID=A0ABU4B3X3_9NOCA|nr:polysaccharide pyruvyl transferase family protein [Rhodococcus cercidiphylli]MDV6233176.1 hypothetical protein [Rhodococcus cercidiphylli]